MRLTCPNCGAQYEVSDDIIPETGRDVQCSNCGHTWFQNSAGYDVEPDDAIFDADGDETVPEMALAPPEPPQVDPELREPEEPEPDLQSFVEEVNEEVQEEVAAAPERARQEIDPTVADILQQEASYEAQLRAAEADAIESQPDLGLDDIPEDPKAEAERRMARLRGEPDPAVAAAATTGARRELLPDIEEINSTLRSTSDRDDIQPNPLTPQAEAKKRRSGFRMGFGFMMILAALAVAAYLYAPQIIEAVPATKEPMTMYVDWVNQARVLLDAQTTNLLDRLNDATGSDGS